MRLTLYLVIRVLVALPNLSKVERRELLALISSLKLVTLLLLLQNLQWIKFSIHSLSGEYNCRNSALTKFRTDPAWEPRPKGGVLSLATETDELIDDRGICQGADITQFVQLVARNLSQNPAHDLPTPCLG